jgi:hypothetical protein
MAITFLPPDLEYPCSVTVGVVAGASDIEQVAESFRGQVNIRPIPESSSALGYDVVFRQSENRQEVEILLPRGDAWSDEHRILVSVAASSFPALDSVAYAVLSPAFAPGVVGIDWYDHCTILRSGRRGVLVMAESGDAIADTLRLAESILVKEGGVRPSMAMAAAAVFAPYGSGLLESVRQLSRAAETLAPDALWLVAAPIILGDTPACAVLAVFPE